MDPKPLLCFVAIGNYGTNVSAATLREAADKAVEFFLDPFWKGPKPMKDTVLTVTAMETDKSYRVWAFKPALNCPVSVPECAGMDISRQSY